MLALTYSFVLLGIVQLALGAVVPYSHNRRGDSVVQLWNTDAPSQDDFTKGKSTSPAPSGGQALTDKATFTIYDNGEKKDVEVSTDEVKDGFDIDYVQANWWWLGMEYALVKTITNGENDLSVEKGDPENILKWLTGKKVKRLTDLSDKDYLENLKKKIVILSTGENEVDQHDEEAEGIKYRVITNVDGEGSDVDSTTVDTLQMGDPYWVGTLNEDLKELKDEYGTVIVLED
nr:uncharacterized protein I203_05927 [Kwoniella mangroviensis CBS 8507]OCF65185.1 hypothetical protein I203_05927 [Kwoniella mangroviensis CBS 8507]